MSEIINKQGDSVIVKGATEITATNVEELKEELQNIIQTPPKQLIIDLVDTVMLDSIGMGAFISTFNALKNTGSEFKVINANNDIYTLLKAMRLDQHFTITPI